MIAAYLNESLPTHVQRDDASSAGLDWIRFAPAMICALDSTGRIRHVSERWLANLGYDRDAVIGVNSVEFLAPSSQSCAAIITLPMLFRSGRCDSVEWTLQSRNGGTMEVLVSAEIMDSADGEPHAVAVFMDISNQKAAWQSLIESEARFRLLSEQSMDMMFQLDENLVWKYASPACREIAGYDPDTLIGRTAFQKLHPDEAEHVRGMFADVAAGRQQHGSLVYRVWHADGRWIWAGTRFRSTRHELTGEPSGLVGTLRDVTAKMEAEKSLAEANRKLEILALHDGLTGIYNRRAFDEILAREIKIAAREHTRLTLLMIDVDCFKVYNDRYGHPAGDAALCSVSAAICRSVRRPADIAARYGGEEFVVLLPGTDEAGGHVIATAIQTSIQDLKLLHELSPFGTLTVSIGIATSPDFAENRLEKDVLINQADMALYIAKREGKNTIVAWTAGRDLLYEYIDLLIELLSTYNLTYLDTVLSVIDDYLRRASLLSPGGDAKMRAALFEAITAHLPVDSASNELSDIIKDKLIR